MVNYLDIDKMCLICLPFAGGNRYSYRDLERFAPSFLRVNTLEYPGRGVRMEEPLKTRVNELVDDLYDQVIPFASSNNQYAIYGHSLGGLVAYLLARKIIDNNLEPPLHLFITGAPAPAALPRNSRKMYLLPKMEFIDEIRHLKGCPEELLCNHDMMKFIEPILRADFEASENYLYKESSPLDLPLTVITGTTEGLEFDEIQLWQKETNAKTDFIRLPGHHFFILEQAQSIMKIVSAKLSQTQLL